MMNYIFGAIMLVSVICGAITGKMEKVSEAVLSGAGESVNLLISLFGMMCFWTGIMKVADKAGLTGTLAVCLSPITKRFFCDYKEDGKAAKAICMNLIANFIGLGNAATPMGLEAMKQMQKESSIGKDANNSMVMFVVLNTASVQLIPTTMAILRKTHGSAAPFDIMPAVWISSIASVIVGVTVAKILEKNPSEKTQVLSASKGSVVVG